MPVVGHPQVAAPGPVPVAEQDRQGAPTGRERYRLGVRGGAVLRPHHLVVRARGVLLATAHVQVVAERERGQLRRALPLGAERRRPRVAAVVAPCLVRTLEPAVAQAAEEHVLAVPQDGEIDPPVPVDVDGVGADHALEVGGGIRHLGEPQLPADRALVAIEGGGVGASGEVEIRPSVVVAVERGDAAADEEREVAVVDVVHAGGGRLPRRSAVEPQPMPMRSTRTR